MSRLVYNLNVLGLLSKRARNAPLIIPGLVEEAMRRLDHAVSEEERAIARRAIGRAQKLKVPEPE